MGATLAAAVVLLFATLAGAQAPSGEPTPPPPAQPLAPNRDASAPGPTAAPASQGQAAPAVPAARAEPAVASTPTPAPTEPAAPTEAVPTRTDTRTPTPTRRSTRTASASPPPTDAAAGAAPSPPEGAAPVRDHENRVLRSRHAAGGRVTFLLGALVALIAAALGFSAGRSRERAERRNARHGLSTGVLAELRRIDGVLRRMITQDSPSTSAPLDHPIIEAALRDLPLFQPETAARIAHFHTLLRSLQATASEYREKPMLWAGRLGEFNQLLKARAAAACRAVPELTKALRNDGGITPPAADKAEGESEGKALPPTPFDSTETDDWTM